MMPSNSNKGVQVNKPLKSIQKKNQSIPKAFQLTDFKNYEINFTLPTPTSCISETSNSSNSVFDDPIFNDFSGLHHDYNFFSDDNNTQFNKYSQDNINSPHQQHEQQQQFINTQSRSSTPNIDPDYDIHFGNLIDIKINDMKPSNLNEFEYNTTNSDILSSTVASSSCSDSGSLYSSPPLPSLSLNNYSFDSTNTLNYHDSSSTDCLSSRKHNSLGINRIMTPSNVVDQQVRSRSLDSAIIKSRHHHHNNNNNNNNDNNNNNNNTIIDFNNIIPSNSDAHFSPPYSPRLQLKCTYEDCKYSGSFQSTDYLKRHYREQHTDKTRHICHGVKNGKAWGCKKIFKRPYQLVNHWKGPRSLKICNVPTELLKENDINRAIVLEDDKQKKIARKEKRKSSTN